MAEKSGDPRLLTICSKYARIRDSLRPYLWREAQYCVRESRPMMAHLCLDWPEDPQSWIIHDEYMLGRELLVAPVTEAGQVSRDVWLPEGRWIPFFESDSLADSGYPRASSDPADVGLSGTRILTGGQTIRVSCPPEKIPVFRKEMSPYD